MDHVLTIDQGTTSTRATLFDGKLSIAASAQQDFAQHFPASGRVAHDPGELWSTTAAAMLCGIRKRRGSDTICERLNIADVQRIMTRQGVFSHPRDGGGRPQAGHPRRLYTANPMAFPVAPAGGAGSTGRARCPGIAPDRLRAASPAAATH